MRATIILTALAVALSIGAGCGKKAERSPDRVPVGAAQAGAPTISVQVDGNRLSYQLDGQPISDEDLSARLDALAQQDITQLVQIKRQPGISGNAVLQAVAKVKSYGFENVKLVD